MSEKVNVLSDWLKVNEFVNDPDAHAYILVCRKLIDKGYLEINRTGRDIGFINYSFTLKGDKQNG